MKPAPFRYLAPRSEDELIATLKDHGAEARLLAGGQSLVPMMNFRVATPSVLVDINGVPGLSFIDLNADGIELGALTRHAMLEDSDAVRMRLPLVTEAMGRLAHRAVRNRGTMGGSLALAYPGAELPLLFVTLGAELALRSPRGTRLVPAEKFIRGALETALADDEFIRSARIPLPPAQAGTAFVEASRRHGDFALAAAAAVIELDAGGRVRVAHAGVTGGTAVPLRLRGAEQALVGQLPVKDVIEELARTAVAAIEVDSDAHYPAGYRKLLLQTMLQRALETAAQRAGSRHVH